MRRSQLQFPLALLFVLLLALATACGSTSRNSLVIETSEQAHHIEAINEVVVAKGYEPKVHKGEVVKFVLDKESKTIVAFKAKRKGVVMVVQTQEEGVAPEKVEEELAHAEEVGNAIVAESEAVFARQEEERARAAEEAAIRRQQEEEAAAQQRAANQEALGEMMDRVSNNTKVTVNGKDVGSQEPQSQDEISCCVNGQFYVCPSASAVDRCVGRFTRCINDNGFDQIERCLETDPPDPSDCDAAPARNNECK